MVPDSSYEVDVDINSSFYFTTKFRHLIIKRKTPAFIYVDIFIRNNNRYQRILAYKHSAIEYMGDKLRDVNGDNLKDFIVYWYGNTGCCLKGFSDVYLSRVDYKSFSEKYTFINPTFSPREKIIRGICYGQPGETEIYKYKWNGETVDTLEYVSYEKDSLGVKTGRIILSTARPYADHYKILKTLNSIPVEYEKVSDYDWFTGTGYK